MDFKLHLIAHIFILVVSSHVRACSEELNRIFKFKCQCLHVILPALALNGNHNVSNHIIKFDKLISNSDLAASHVLQIQYDPDLVSASLLGDVTDSFLQTRPHWIIYNEDYSWNTERSGMLVFIRMLNIDTALEQMAAVLNPINCSADYLVTRGYHDFDQYGNEHNNLASFYDYYMGTITLVVINRYAKFLDDGYCPLQQNKHLCAFLPVTNCELPNHYTQCINYNKTCTPGKFVYQGAHAEATVVTSDADSFNVRELVPKHTVTSISMVGNEYRSVNLFDFNEVDSRKYSINSLGSLFFTAIFWRRNYDFRTRTAKLMNDFRLTTHPHFSPNDQCIGLHIRHHDRVKVGHDMKKYCDEFVRLPNNTCYNRTTSEPIIEDCRRHADLAYACDTAVPFGAIPFGVYLQAAEYIRQRTIPDAPKSVFIVTDDGEWVNQESQAFKGEWRIYVLPAPPRHRSRATINGVTMFASMELLQQCSGLVGHTVSAFTVLLRAIMCVRHGPRDSMRFGECPPFYDFRTLSGH